MPQQPYRQTISSALVAKVAFVAMLFFWLHIKHALTASSHWPSFIIPVNICVCKFHIFIIFSLQTFCKRLLGYLSCLQAPSSWFSSLSWFLLSTLLSIFSYCQLVAVVLWFVLREKKFRTFSECSLVCTFSFRRLMLFHRFFSFYFFLFPMNLFTFPLLIFHIFKNVWFLVLTASLQFTGAVRLVVSVEAHKE